MDHPRLVGGGERRRDRDPHVHREGDAAGIADRHARELLVEAHALDELHHEAHEAALGIGRQRVEADDVRVLHPAQRPRLVDDPRLPRVLRLARLLPDLGLGDVEDLDRDLAQPLARVLLDRAEHRRGARLVERHGALVGAEPPALLGCGQEVANGLAEGGHAWRLRDDKSPVQCPARLCSAG